MSNAANSAPLAPALADVKITKRGYLGKRALAKLVAAGASFRFVLESHFLNGMESQLGYQVQPTGERTAEFFASEFSMGNPCAWIKEGALMVSSHGVCFRVEAI